ncbi:MAG: hypothetical protein BAJALOKI2v1_1090007 [Promethearchaeota archaeon]|nr:MAG: hypothetical protein BAJALOKI2v1_1090007 [Candidatus Lokiarchaeota archaeon]
MGQNLEGIPALLYSVFWQTKAMGFLKEILEDLKVQDLSILLYFRDYKPGCLIILDGDKGVFEIESVDDPSNFEYDGAVFGEMKYLLKLIKNHMLLKGFWYLITGKIKLKGIKGLLKFLNIIKRLAI